MQANVATGQGCPRFKPVLGRGTDPGSESRHVAPEVQARSCEDWFRQRPANPYMPCLPPPGPTLVGWPQDHLGPSFINVHYPSPIACTRARRATRSRLVLTAGRGKASLIHFPAPYPFGTMAATAASPASTPPTPPTGLPAFARVTSASLLQRNASTSSSVSTATSESSSSLVAVPIRPPPIQTRTAATPEAQLPSDVAADYSEPEPAGMYGGRGFARNGPRMARQATEPPRTFGPSGRQTPSIITTDVGRSPSLPPSLSPTTPRAPRLPLPDSMMGPVSPQQLRVTVADDDIPGTPSRAQVPHSNPGTPTTLRARAKSRNQSMDSNHVGISERERRQSQLSTQSNGSAASKRPSLRDYILGEELGRGSYSTVRFSLVMALTLARLFSPLLHQAEVFLPVPVLLPSSSLSRS